MKLLLGQSGLSLEIPDDWWQEANMSEFIRASSSYSYESKPDVQNILLENIAPLSRAPGSNLDYGGFDRQRMIKILEGFVQGNVMLPIEVHLLPSGSYTYGLRNGFHRFYASMAAGFQSIPAIVVPYFNIYCVE